MLCTFPAAHEHPALLPCLQTDPLRETLDKVLPKENRELITEVPVSIPQGVKDICNELELEDGIEYVGLGRQAEERRVVSQVSCLGALSQCGKICKASLLWPPVSDAR